MNSCEEKKNQLIFDKGLSNCEEHHNNFVPKQGLQGMETDINKIIPNKYWRKELDLPDVPENEIVRHYLKLSKQNYSVDEGIYPLGSCTMKYNPKINEKISQLPHLTQIHPLQNNVQGCLQIIYELERSLCEITGMDDMNVCPAAGAHGEFAGILIMKKHFEMLGELKQKNKIIVPDSAHGTNPASAAMAGFSIIQIDSDDYGELPLDKLEFAMKGGDVAGLMLTNPNTLGIFDRNITKITEIVHKYGGLCYYDGANLNPILGICRPGDMGFDIVHLNLHKTFSTPHGGGGPGVGPVGVKDHLKKFLPNPRVIYNQESKTYNFNNCETSIGRIHGNYGNFGVFIKAYAYIRALGPDGLKKVAENSVINANYIKSKISKKYHIPLEGNCMHEFVINAELPNDVNAEDVAKRLLDYGVYAPTIYFPLIIHEAMMIEPTETESKKRLDEFIEILLKIFEESETNPELLKNAPQNTIVGRLDATLAARKPNLHD